MTTETLKAPLDTIKWDGRERGYIPSNPPVIHPALALHTSTTDEIEPVTAEVVRYAMMNINLEHADLIQRLAVSPVVMLSRDFQASILTEVGDLVYLGSGVQYYSNFHSLIVKYIMENYQAETLADGDMLLCNDPYIGCAHQCDTSVVAPIFVDGKLFCWIANSMHFQDLGGTVPGSLCVSAKDCWQESAIWTPVTLVEKGRVRFDVEELFVRQSRFPEVTRMDLRAAYGSLETTRKKIVALIERYGAEVVKGIMNRVLDAGEELFVERLSRIPDGRWSYRASMEGSVPGDHEFYRYQINVVKQGDRIIVDNEGSDPQAGAINVTYAGMSGCVLSSLTSQMLPEMAGAFGGAYRHIGFQPHPWNGLVRGPPGRRKRVGRLHPDARDERGCDTDMHDARVRGRGDAGSDPGGADAQPSLGPGRRGRRIGPVLPARGQQRAHGLAGSAPLPGRRGRRRSVVIPGLDRPQLRGSGDPDTVPGPQPRAAPRCRRRCRAPPRGRRPPRDPHGHRDRRG